ncbi:MAG TPA: hypothetical protein VGH69_07370 [Mycobacterium sp.]|jgi:hypothetical protein
MITMTLCAPAGGGVVVLRLGVGVELVGVGLVGVALVGVALVGVGRVGVGLGGQVLCFARQAPLLPCAAPVEVTDAALVETP